MLAYFDAFSGAAGDMMLGALADAGLDTAALRATLSRLPVPGWSLHFEKVRRLGMTATKADVRMDPAARQPERHLSDILDIIDRASLPPAAADKARLAFRRLGEAEARVHGVPLESIHFHEVGAVDAIVDIVGTCVGMEMLGVTEVRCSPLAVGSGTVRAAHGVMPVPTPATAELLRLAGAPTQVTPEVGELLTPTGAALLTTLATLWGPPPAMRITAVGYGAGTREGRTTPNLLRVMLGTAAGTDGSPQSDGGQDVVWQVEANLDDTTGETVGYAIGRLLEAGALDAWAVPLQMKKSRPGVMLAALAESATLPAVEELLFAETGTFGVRRRVVLRSKLARHFVEVALPGGTVRIKVGRRAGRVVTAAPEFEDCRRIAEATGAPLRDVMTAAREAWARLPDTRKQGEQTGA